MSPELMKRLAELVEARAGLSLPPEQAYRVESRLAPVVAGVHPPTLDGLTAALDVGPPDALAAAVTEALLNTETTFFRDREVFAHLREVVLPAITARGSTPRVWSAACGAGQEPYSLAMTAAEAGLRLDICASDLSEAGLQKARAGAYSQFEVQRGLPVARLLRCFDKVEDLWRVKPELRSAVRWRRFNLMDDAAVLGGFDLILCRYAVAGMTETAGRAVLASLGRALRPGGALLLGLDEGAGLIPDMLEAAPGGRGLYQLKASKAFAA